MTTKERIEQHRIACENGNVITYYGNGRKTTTTTTATIDGRTIPHVTHANKSAEQSAMDMIRAFAHADRKSKVAEAFSAYAHCCADGEQLLIIGIAIANTVCNTAYKASGNETILTIKNTPAEFDNLVQTAIVALLEEQEQATIDGRTDSENGLPWYEREHEQTKLKKRVGIQDSKSVYGFETVMLTPMRNVYRIVREQINHHASIESNVRGYSYLENTVKDSDGSEYESYIRLKRYSSLTGQTIDENGHEVCTNISHDNAVRGYNLMEKFIREGKLSEREKQFLWLRLQGRGYDSIATYYGVSKSSVRTTLNRVGVKFCRVFGINDISVLNAKYRDCTTTPAECENTTTTTTTPAECESVRIGDTIRKHETLCAFGYMGDGSLFHVGQVFTDYDIAPELYTDREHPVISIGTLSAWADRVHNTTTADRDNTTTADRNASAPTTTATAFHNNGMKNGSTDIQTLVRSKHGTSYND